MGWKGMARVCAGVAVWFVASGARGSSLTLTSDAPVAAPLVLAASASGQVIVRVFNDTGADAVADTMSAWQVRLVIVADSGASGTVSFTSPASGSAPTPAGYVFGASGLGILVTNATSQIDANDLHDSTGTGASQVPVSPGASLIALGLTASANASGTFGIFAVEGANATVWTDDAASPQTRFFVNVPNAGSTVRIAQVSVPEPAGAALALAFFAGLCATRGRRPRLASGPGARGRSRAVHSLRAQVL